MCVTPSRAIRGPRSTLAPRRAGATAARGGTGGDAEPKVDRWQRLAVARGTCAAIRLGRVGPATSRAARRCHGRARLGPTAPVHTTGARGATCCSATAPEKGGGAGGAATPCAKRAAVGGTSRTAGTRAPATATTQGRPDMGLGLAAPARLGCEAAVRVTGGAVVTATAGARPAVGGPPATRLARRAASARVTGPASTIGETSAATRGAPT